MTRRTDILGSLLLVCISCLLLVWVIPDHTSPPQSEGNLSPAFLPSIAAGLMGCLAVVLFVTALLRSPDKPDELHEEFGEESRGIGIHELRDIVIWIVFAVAMMVGFLHAGFVITAVIALAMMMWFTGQRNLVAIAITALAVPIFLQQIAWYAFTVQMP